MKSLGVTLKEAREKNNFTLRQVDEMTGISSAYLSQLENEKIKKPSANVLYKLAATYGEQLNNFLRAAGIIQTTTVHQEEISEEEQWANKLAFYAKSLSKEELDEIVNFIKFKVQNNQKKKDG